MRFKESTFIVFEGLDAAGKSTTAIATLQLLQKRGVLNMPLFTHQPSGSNELGQAIYELTENAKIESNVARQFLHLASHAEHYEEQIIPHLSNGGSIIMDRCWWSAIAYGYGSFARYMDRKSFFNMVTLPAKDHMPTLFFLFMKPFESDRHNTQNVENEYWELAEQHAQNTVIMDIERSSPEEAADSVISILFQQGLLMEDK